MSYINIRKHLTGQYKGIVESFLSLSILNAVNIILPLITLPYLIRVVGLEKYGAYSIVYTILQYVLLLSAYGFSYTTTKLIAQNREDISLVSKIFYSTIYARLAISIPALFFFLLVILLFYPSDYLIMYVGGIGMVLGDILNPVWLFQGYEKMRYMTIANFICKILFTILIFVFITSEGDYIYINVLNSLGYIVSGIITIYISYKYFHIRRPFFRIPDIVLQFKEGWSVFLSTIFMNLYRNSNIFILGFFVSEYNVGIYSAAEKVIKAVQSLIAPVSNALFPYFAASFKNNDVPNNARRVIALNKKLFYALLLLSLIVIATSDIMNTLISGGEDKLITYLICLMSPVICIGGMNYILGIVGLVNLNYNHLFLKFVTISGLASMAFLIITVPIAGVYSASLSMIIAETVLFFYCFRQIKMAASN